MPFIINDDLDNLVFDHHNKFHFFASMAFAMFFTNFMFAILLSATGFWFAAFLAWFIGYSVTYNLGVHWEIGDGFKKWYTYGVGVPWVIRQFKYSNGFSFQDFLVWDLFGSLGGATIGIIIGIIYIIAR